MIDVFPITVELNGGNDSMRGVRILKKTSVSLLAAVCMVSLLGGCSQAEQKTGDKDAASAASKKPVVSTTTNPNGQKQIKISLESLPNDMVICTVAGKPITIADYRRMMKIQQAQAQTNISNDAVLRTNLYAQATKRGVSLTADEKSKLLESAQAQHKDFPAFLKEKNMTQAQFDKEVEQAGIVFKMSNQAIEEGLLSQLVSRQLLASATSDPAVSKQAGESFDKLKQSPNFEQLRKQTGLTADELKTETVRAELARIQVEKLQKSIKISDREIQGFYKKNTSQLKHKERLRLSRIVVLAPEQNQGPILSIREQVKRVNPKLEGKELDATVAQVMQQQQQKALVLLGEAKASALNFAKLANENTEDPMSRILKNGGDMGWQEKQQLVPQFADAVWTVQAGSVLPKLVKTSEGYSIIKVTAHEKPGVMSLADVRGAIEQKLKQDKLQQVLNTWLADRQKTVKVEFSPKFLAIANGGEVPKVQ